MSEAEEKKGEISSAMNALENQLTELSELTTSLNTSLEMVMAPAATPGKEPQAKEDKISCQMACWIYAQHKRVRDVCHELLALRQRLEL